MKMGMIKFICLLSLFAFVFTQDSFNKQFLAPTDNSTTSPSSSERFINTTLHFIDSPLMDIVWCGEQTKTIFFLTEKNTLYKSVDEGFSGHILTDHLQQLGKQELNGSKSEVGQVSQIIKSPIDKSMILFVGTEGINWITEDCGATYRAMDQGRHVDEFKFHPTEKTWLLASAWTLCEDFGGEPCRKYKELFVSKDLGTSWDFIQHYVFQFEWGRVDQSFHTIPKERIVIVFEPEGKGNQKTGGWIDNLEVVYSDDFFRTFSPMVRGGNKLLLTHFFMFVVQVNEADSQEITLLIGDPQDQYYTLRPIELPVKRLLEHSYTILDTSERSVFLQINHDGEQSRYGNIYISDSTGTRYSLALSGNVRTQDGQCDFERVRGVEGIYLSNVYNKQALKKLQGLESSSFPQQNAGGKKSSSNPMEAALYGNEAIEKSIHDYKKTMISFDKGAIWQTLTPPETDADGKRIICNSDEDCSLHLHSFSNTNFGPFYTAESSLGIVLGTGNVGAYLSNQPDEINTYLSRDGGLTWFEIAKGSHTYEIGDHGSIIVMAPNQRATKEVLYSWNEGLTWHTQKISDTPIEVSNIITEPTNTAERFLVYGRTKDSARKGAIIAVDFTPLMQRWCKGHDEPDTPNSDYETWVPNGKISPHCLMGRQVTYVRRKREAECFNAEENEKKWKSFKHCACTEEDWECELGYTRVGAGPCVSIDPKMQNQSRSIPENCSDYYYFTQGYRKIAGDSCKGGIDHEPIKLTCPATSQLNSKNLMVLLSFIAIVLGLVWLSNKGNSIKVKGHVDRLYKKLTGLIPSREKKENVGFRNIGDIPDTMRDEEDNLGDMVFEETEDQAEPIEDEKLQEFAQGKRMTERRAMEAANKRVPTLSRPGEKNSYSNRDLYDYSV